MSKGFVKTWRSEADIPQLWQNTTLFCVYQKLKILAARPGWTVTLSIPALAKRLCLSPNTLQKSIKELAEIGLIYAGKNEEGVTRLELLFCENEPNLEGLTVGVTRATSKQLAQARRTAPKRVSKNDMPAKPSMSKNDIPTISKNDMPTLYKQEELHSKKTTNPLLSPMDFMAEFATFWNLYPNKKGKQRAIRRWKRGAYDVNKILPVLAKQKKLREWNKQDGQFVPRADAYLNQKRWEDVLPEGEEFYILDFKQPKTERETTLSNWLCAVSPSLLENDNQKINSVFEKDRCAFEEIVALAGTVSAAFEIMRHGWRKGCNGMLSIREKAAAYRDELKREGKIV